MRVYCTKKLQDFIGNVEVTMSCDSKDIKISDWYAHLFFVQNRKCIVYVNILTYYCVFISDIVKKDLKNIDEIFKNRLQEQLEYDRILDDYEEAIFLTGGSEIGFLKTSNIKKAIGKINDYVYRFKMHCFHKYANLSEMDVVSENNLFNKTSTRKYCDGKNTWSCPADNVKEYLS
jgi:hypothetical protein